MNNPERVIGKGDKQKKIEFRIDESPALEFNINLNSHAWNIKHKKEERLIDFYTIEPKMFDNNDLFKKRSSVYQIIKEKFIYCCKSAQYFDESNHNQFFEEFMSYLREIPHTLPLPNEIKTKSEVPKKNQFSDKKREEIEDFLESEEKFRKIKEILDHKIVGEENNKMILYLLQTGGPADIYAIVVVVGDSSGGKSFLSDCVIDLIPQKYLKKLTGASDKALVYWERKDEMVLVIHEVQRNENLVEALKDFRDEGIIYIVTEKNQENQLVSREYKVENISVLVTTTANLNDEFINGAWQLNPDLSVKQSENIVKRDLEREESLKELERQIEYEKNRELLRNAYEMLNQEFNFSEIKIPFATALEGLLNFRYTRIRRDKKKLKDLIKIITMWNYKLRESFEFKGKKVLLSHPKDLKTALDIGKSIFENISSNLTEEKRKILDYIGEMRPISQKKSGDSQGFQFLKKAVNEYKSWFKTNEIYNAYCDSEQYTKSKKSFRNLLNSLTEDGYLTYKKDGRANAYKLEREALISNADKDVILKESYEKYYQKRNEFILDKNVKFRSKELLENSEYNFNENEQEDSLIDENNYAAMKEKIIELSHDSKEYDYSGLKQLLSLEYNPVIIPDILNEMIKRGFLSQKNNIIKINI